MSKTVAQTYEDRIKTLKRRRNFLADRLSDYQGRAEYSAIQWAIVVLENHHEAAMDVIEAERRDRQEQEAEPTGPRNNKGPFAPF